MKSNVGTPLKKNTLAILISASLVSCSSVPVEDQTPQAQYGVEQIAMNGKGQFVLCNPCLLPTIKEPETTNEKVALRYGDSLSVGARSVMSALTAMALSVATRATAQATTGIGQGPVAVVPSTPSATGVVQDVDEPGTDDPAPAGDVYKMLMSRRDAEEGAKDRVNDVTAAPNVSLPSTDPEAMVSEPLELSPSEVVKPMEVKPEPEVQVASTEPIPPYKNEQTKDPANRFTVNFASNSSDLDEKALDRLLEALRNAPAETRIVIVGYSDSTGGVEVNERIVQSRSSRVRDWFKEQGVSDDKVVADPTASKGLCCYINDNTSEAGRAANRRVEITIVHDPRDTAADRTAMVKGTSSRDQTPASLAINDPVKREDKVKMEEPQS